MYKAVAAKTSGSLSKIEAKVPPAKKVSKNITMPKQMEIL